MQALSGLGREVDFLVQQPSFCVVVFFLSMMREKGAVESGSRAA